MSDSKDKKLEATRRELYRFKRENYDLKCVLKYMHTCDKDPYEFLELWVKKDWDAIKKLYPDFDGYLGEEG
jgi:hypothetical protein